jgi:hypothetical protein
VIEKKHQKDPKTPKASEQNPFIPPERAITTRNTAPSDFKEVELPAKKRKSRKEGGKSVTGSNSSSNENSGEETDHSWDSLCYLCKTKDKINRKLLLCEGFNKKTDKDGVRVKERCPKVSHIKCSNFIREPEDDWYCF